MAREVKIGILSFTVLVILIWGYNFLKGKNLFENNKEYYIKYDDVAQLEVASPVYVHGFKVGSVTDIKIDPEDYSKILVTIDIKGNIKIPKDTKAVIMTMGIVAGKAIVLEITHNCEGDDCAQNHDYLQGEVRGLLGSMIPENELDSYLAKLRNSFKQFVDSISNSQDSSSIMQDTKDIISNLAGITQKLDVLLARTDKNIESSIDNIQSLTQSLKDNNDNIAGIITNLKDITASLKQARIDSLIIKGNKSLTSINGSVAQLDKVLNKTDKAIAQIDKLLEDMNKGKGTMGKLMKDEELYNELKLTLKHTNLLLQDMRLYPGRYFNLSIIKRKNKKYVKPDYDPGLQQ